MDGVDEESSIKDWKDRMRGHCTYLPEAFALPKGSFVAETLLILNELNVLSAIDKNNNTYYLTTNDKINVYEIADNFKDLDNLKIKNFGIETTEEWAKFVIFWI